MNNLALQKYKDTMGRILSITFPNMKGNDLMEAIDYSIEKRYKEEPAQIYNNYSDKTVDTTLLDMANYIIEREPIMTSYGVLWKQHGTVPNPLLVMIDKFLDNRNILKNKMFQFQPGSEDYERYNLLQVLAKIDANGLYGTLGMFSCMYYNLHVASTITTQGRSLVSAAGLCFEAFLANNVKFGSLDDVVVFIDNVLTEEWEFNDHEILDGDVTVEDCFTKIVSTIGFEWMPDEEDLDIIYKLLFNLDQTAINRLYYKNNLYGFMANKTMENAIIFLLETLNEPYLNPLEIPEEIEDEMGVFCDLLMEYVYYPHQTIDSIDRMDNMIKSVCVISDTDSTIISLDAWYRFVLGLVKDKKLNILYKTTDAISVLEGEPKVTIREPRIDYDFYEDKVIETSRYVDMISIIPQDGLRFSIINILSNCLDKIVNKHMEAFTILNNSHRDSRKCRIIMKNEFLFRTALLSNVKKNYAVTQDLQEGRIRNNKLAVTGLAIDKSTLKQSTRDRLKDILYEDILKMDVIDQIRVIKQLVIFEKEIYNSLESGSKDYYKPLNIKSMSAYETPMSEQGIKASVVWNLVRDEDLEAIDLDIRNAIDVVKVNITANNVSKIKDTYPETYDRLVELIGLPKQKATNPQYANTFKGKITSIAIPKDVSTPEWILDFIDYTTIINDNITNFPVASIGISTSGKKTINYTNIVSL